MMGFEPKTYAAIVAPAAAALALAGEALAAPDGVLPARSTEADDALRDTEESPGKLRGRLLSGQAQNAREQYGSEPRPGAHRALRTHPTSLVRAVVAAEGQA
jgi:hypothetical protein